MSRCRQRPMRERVLEALQLGPTTGYDLAAALSAHLNSVRCQLVALEADGLAARTGRLPGSNHGGKGCDIWRAVDQARTCDPGSGQRVARNPDLPVAWVSGEFAQSVEAVQRLVGHILMMDGVQCIIIAPDGQLFAVPPSHPRFEAVLRKAPAWVVGTYTKAAPQAHLVEDMRARIAEIAAPVAP